MQSSEERGTGAARPSLLGAAQQKDADRNRILSNLERDGGASAAAAVAGSPWWVWGAGVGMVGLLVVGAVYLLGGEATPEAYQPAPSRYGNAALLASAPAAPAASVAPAIASATVAGTVAAPTVAAASVAETAPASGTAQAATIHDEVASGALNTAPAPGAAPSVNEVLGATAAVGAVGAAGAVAAVAAKPKAKPARKPKPVAKAHKESDSDVVLLSALMAHVQSNRKREEAAANSKANAAPAFKSCRKLTGRKAEQCRERICTKRAATDPACAGPAA